MNKEWLPRVQEILMFVCNTRLDSVILYSDATFLDIAQLVLVLLRKLGL